MFHDLRFAVRQLAISPAFTLIAVVTLALGIGSATTAFSALNALLLKPLPLIQQQDRMLHVTESIAQYQDAGICYLDFLEWRARSRTLAALWLYQGQTVVIGGATESERVLGAGLTAGAFQAMGVQPVHGRLFRDEEDNPKAESVALLGHGLWQRHFGGDPDVVGRVVTLNGVPTTIVGIMPPGWRYPKFADLWRPLRQAPDDAKRGDFNFNGHAMLKPGVTLEQARAELAMIAGALAQEYPATNQGVEVRLRPVREEAVADTAQLTWLLFIAVMFVFLIACANVANLLLARAASRTREIAIRLALGAGRRRLLLQLLTESLVLGLLGGAGGLLFASWGVPLMVAAIPVELPFWLSFDFDPVVFGFILALSVLASLLFGLFPAWQASRPDVVDELKEGGRGSGGGARSHRLRNGLVVAEIALALVLLVGAGLMMRSFLRLRWVEPGFDARHVLTFRVGFPPTMATDPAVVTRYFQDLLPRLASLPGVEAAGAASILPGIGAGGVNAFVLEGQPEPQRLIDSPSAHTRVVTPGYFATLHIPLVSGRDFAAADTADRPRVTVIDTVFAKRFFGDTNPLGRRLSIFDKPGQEPKWIEVVGVVGNVRHQLDKDEPLPTFYTPHAQSMVNFMSVALRVRGDPAPFMDAARAEVLAVNRDIPLYNVWTLEHAIEREVWFRRFFGWLFAIFAGIALALAALGIYGVTAYNVAQRTHEIGIRMALGAQPGEVIGMVLRQGLRLVGTGLAVGLVAAFYVARLLAANLYGVSPHDPPTFAAVPVLLAAVALLACYIPARRATRIDPIIALRAE